jgi:hypothetical protein
MTAVELVQAVEATGARMEVIGDRLRIEAPAGVITPELQDAIRERKPEMLQILDAGAKTARQQVFELIKRYQCPDRCGPLVLQDRARDCWFCPGCRLWVVEGVIH